MAVLKTTSPPVSPSAPNAVPWNTVPSASARVAGLVVDSLIVSRSARSARSRPSVRSARWRSTPQPLIEIPDQTSSDAHADGAAAELHAGKRRVPRARLERRRVDPPRDVGIDERDVG